MNALEKRNLTTEAKMQTEALKKINRWKMIAMAIPHWVWRWPTQVSPVSYKLLSWAFSVLP